ncbi:MAG TPA: hypothetical protein VKK61_03155, partial [Tepidisphaeraceae bacterium]|nr:hypothetical protein [Tepidisphaeraceae bacterium]
MKMRQSFLMFLLLAVFGVFLIWPIAQVVQVGFFGFDGKFTLAYLLSIFQSPVFREGLFNSAIIAVSVTILCTIIAVPLAMLSVRLDFWGKGIVSGLILVPLILPPFVGAIGMRQILGKFGALTSLLQAIGLVPHGRPIDWLGAAPLAGIILVEALSLYPI